MTNLDNPSFLSVAAARLAVARGDHPAHDDAILRLAAEISDTALEAAIPGGYDGCRRGGHGSLETLARLTKRCQNGIRRRITERLYYIMRVRETRERVVLGRRPLPWVQVGYDKDKFKQLILYVAKKSETDPRFGAVKLNKLLFFSDFSAYAQLGHSITGARYWKIAHGPAPAALVPARDELVDAGDLEQRAEDIGPQYKPRIRLIAHREPDKKAFSDDERAVIDDVIQRYWELDGTQISRESYEEPGVELANENEDIPYSSVFLDLRTWNEADTAEARRRMKLRGWAA